MAAGYSPNPLFKKLGLKEGFIVKLIHPPADYLRLLGDIANTLIIQDNATAKFDLIHLFTNSVSEYEAILPVLKSQIKKNGAIWVSWYKKSSCKATELTENIIRNTALYAVLVDVKVSAVDEDWSGLKLVFRLKDR